MAGDCSARFAALNHGKETLEADLATASGRAAVRELAASADVFLHSLAPGKDVRLGLDAEALATARPGLVHAAASGWGDARGQRPPIGTDFPVQAWSGLAALVTPPGLAPAPSLLTLTDVLGGVVCAEGAVAGLLAARLTGRGGAVSSSLLSAARLLCRPEFRSPDARPSVPDRADLAALAADPRFAPAFTTATAGPAGPAGPAADRCVLVRSPWEFDR
jgi:crotonobetainyl-CoA:carnitine CoA-transferase CaiB-like acyl-CoA transferase